MTRSELIRRLTDANPAIHVRDIAAAVEILFSFHAGKPLRDRLNSISDYSERHDHGLTVFTPV